MPNHPTTAFLADGMTVSATTKAPKPSVLTRTGNRCAADMFTVPAYISL